MTRTEFGFERTVCACKVCVRKCEVMPGFLVPSDLERMIPDGVDRCAWAETNLLASPGALLITITGEIYRIPTLVPAIKPDGSCIHLINKSCTIHENAPFGCAFFDCRPDNRSSLPPLLAVHKAWHSNTLYRRLWFHLAVKDLTQLPPEILQERM